IVPELFLLRPVGLDRRAKAVTHSRTRPGRPRARDPRAHAGRTSIRSAAGPLDTVAWPRPPPASPGRPAERSALVLRPRRPTLTPSTLPRRAGGSGERQTERPTSDVTSTF